MYQTDYTVFLGQHPVVLRQAYIESSTQQTIRKVQALMNEQKHEEAGRLFLSAHLASILWEDCQFDTKCSNNDDATTGISSMMPNDTPPVAINVGLLVGIF